MGVKLFLFSSRYTEYEMLEQFIRFIRQVQYFKDIAITKMCWILIFLHFNVIWYTLFILYTKLPGRLFDFLFFIAFLYFYCKLRTVNWKRIFYLATHSPYFFLLYLTGRPGDWQTGRPILLITELIVIHYLLNTND